MHKKNNLRLEDIIEIRKAKKHDKGYEIVFSEEHVIWLLKRRTLPALLLLIKYKTCSEADLAGANNRLSEIKEILKGKFDEKWIRDRYGDANKPFSELWTEEGFTVISAQGMKGNRQYVLEPDKHEKLFMDSAKYQRIQLSESEKKEIREKQKYKCNLCGSLLIQGSVQAHIFAKDRKREEFDHRIPIERGGDNNIDNFQALCHYCNKSKRQICFICDKKCSLECALASPEKHKVILATSEDISDRISK